MSIPTPRYAIYFVPGAETALYRFGASVIGYDCYTGRDIAPIDGVDARTWPAFVREPRLYGFHATLKAPFRLAVGVAEADLERAFLAFAADQPAVSIGGLAVSELGSFIALVPKALCPPLGALAQACVREFDRFRAPLSAPERERRLAAGLSARQIENLERWGYPYVFDDFRFHMSLTGALAPADRQRALPPLRAAFAKRADAATVTLDQIVIARQPEGGAPFQAIRLATLAYSPGRPDAYCY
jgi:putative phosphonate metabolism protein